MTERQSRVEAFKLFGAIAQVALIVFFFARRYPGEVVFSAVAYLAAVVAIPYALVVFGLAASFVPEYWEKGKNTLQNRHSSR